MNNWTEIIVQLWVPSGSNQAQAMKVDKALSIIAIVEKMLPLDAEGIVKIEFGDSEFDTRQMFPNEIRVIDGSLVVDLRPDTVQCKAQTRGGSCGTSDKNGECCTPVTQKPKVQLINLAPSTEKCCTPGGGCC